MSVEKALNAAVDFVLNHFTACIIAGLLTLVGLFSLGTYSGVIQTKDNGKIATILHIDINSNHHVVYTVRYEDKSEEVLRSRNDGAGIPVRNENGLSLIYQCSRWKPLRGDIVPPVCTITRAEY